MIHCVVLTNTNDVYVDSNVNYILYFKHYYEIGTRSDVIVRSVFDTTK